MSKPPGGFSHSPRSQQAVEKQWGKAERRALPGYFTAFGVPSAAAYLAELEEKAKQEAALAGQRAPSPAEQRAIGLLTELVRSMAPEIMSVLDKSRTSYTVAKTEAVLGELNNGRSYRSREVFLGEDVFEADFARAFAIFLHEHAHIFGSDGSRGFTDALTELVETVIRFRHSLGAQEANWNALRRAVAKERKVKDQAPRIPAGKRLETLDEAELRELLRKLPSVVLDHLLQQHGTAATSCRST